jgi:putative transposase
MVLARGEVSKDAELLVLRHQNAVLRRRSAGSSTSRATGMASALSRLIPRCRWGEVFAVASATLLV